MNEPLDPAPEETAPPQASEVRPAPAAQDLLDGRYTGSLQLGVQRFLYTGYFLFGCVATYLFHQIVTLAWGEGHDLPITIASVIAGVAAVYFGWKNDWFHSHAQETLDELVAVTWPSREETWTATVVVIVTGVVSALAIFLMDKSWLEFTGWVFK